MERLSQGQIIAAVAAVVLLVAEFLPWLRAARWVGVGRQTVWGKGDVRVLESGSSPGRRMDG